MTHKIAHDLAIISRVCPRPWSHSQTPLVPSHHEKHNELDGRVQKAQNAFRSRVEAPGSHFAVRQRYNVNVHHQFTSAYDRKSPFPLRRVIMYTLTPPHSTHSPLTHSHTSTHLLASPYSTEKEIDEGLRLGDYPVLPWRSAQQERPFGWWDNQDRRDKETPVRLCRLC